MNLSAKKTLLMGLPVVLGLCLTLCSVSPAFSQVAGADQGIFSDEEQMLRIKNAQIGQYEQQKSAAERDLQTEDAQNGQYRLYAEKRVQELSKPTARGGKPADKTQLEFFQNWLKRDAAYRQRQQAYINQLQTTIQSMQSGTQQTISNLGNDINGMREAVQDKKDAQKFSQMMQMNYFNELQSEMGACSWGRPPTDGTFNSTGGYGMMGGYGVGFGGRRNYGGGW